MTDPLDTLRDALDQITNYLNHDGDEETMTDEVLAVLKAASPEQRRALLELLGYEVREGWLHGDMRTNWSVEFSYDVTREPVLVLRLKEGVDV